MNPAIHYTDAEIAARGTEVCRHLILCADCRRRADLPTVEVFRKIVISETSSSGTPSFNVTNRPGLLARLLGGSKLRLSFAASSLVFLATICLIAVSWRRHDPRSIAGIDETMVALPALTETSDPSNKPVEDSDHSQQRYSRSLGQRDKSRSRNEESKDPTKPRNTENLTVSKTRGNGGSGRVQQPCTQAVEAGGAYSGEDGATVIRWSGLKGAIKWHLYVADDNEVLVEEFVSDQALSYTLKTTLKTDRAYVWRIVYTMTDGSNLGGPSGKLQSGAELRKGNSRNDRDARQTRCSYAHD